MSLASSTKKWIAKYPSRLPILAAACSEPECGAARGIRRLVRHQQGIWLCGRYCCSAQCFEISVERACRKLLPQASATFRERSGIPIGLVLLSRGAINEGQLRSALEAQHRNGYGRLGHWLREVASLDERDIAGAVSEQCGCPVLGSDKITIPDSNLVPAALLRAERMVPVHFSQDRRLLYLAFAGRLNRSVLYGVEQMLSCRVEPCILAESTLADALTQIEQTACGSEIVFSTTASRDVASILRNYAVQIGADEVGLVVCGQALWARLNSKGKSVHLLFDCSTGTTSPRNVQRRL